MGRNYNRSGGYWTLDLWFGKAWNCVNGLSKVCRPWRFKKLKKEQKWGVWTLQVSVIWKSVEVWVDFQKCVQLLFSMYMYMYIYIYIYIYSCWYKIVLHVCAFTCMYMYTCTYLLRCRVSVVTVSLYGRASAYVDPAVGSGYNPALGVSFTQSELALTCVYVCVYVHVVYTN